MNYFVNIDISQQKKARPFTAEPSHEQQPTILMKRKLLNKCAYLLYWKQTLVTLAPYIFTR